MGSGIGTTLTFIVAGVLWLAYLVPALRRNREDLASERNAHQIQQALRTIVQSTTAEQTPPVRRPRAPEYVADSAEIARSRSVKLSLSAFALIAGIATGIFGFAGEWLGTMISLGVLGLSLVGLVLVNGARTEVNTEQRVRRYTGLPEVDDTWTPIRTPKVHHSVPEGAGLIVDDESIRRAEDADRAARVREQTARVVAETEPAIDPRFAEFGPATDEVAAVDINAALRARRAQ